MSLSVFRRIVEKGIVRKLGGGGRMMNSSIIRLLCNAPALPTPPPLTPIPIPIRKFILTATVGGLVVGFGLGFHTAFQKIDNPSSSPTTYIINSDAASQELQFNHSNYYLAAVARTEDGEPVKACIQLLKNPELKADEMELIKARMCFQTLETQLDKLLKEAENEKKAKGAGEEGEEEEEEEEEEAEIGEELEEKISLLFHQAKIALDTSKKLGAIKGSEYTELVTKMHTLRSEKVMSDLKIEAKEMKNLIGRMIREKFGDRKSCESTLEAELQAIFLALNVLVEDDKEIVVKSDNNDAVNKIISTSPTKKKSRTPSEMSRDKRTELLVAKIKEKMKKKKKVLYIAHVPNTKNKLADAFARYGKLVIGKDKKNGTEVCFNKDEIKAIPEYYQNVPTRIGPLIQRERLDKELWN